MSGLIWVLIPLVAIVGAYIIDYQKNKLKWQAKNSRYDDEVTEIRKMVSQMKKRIENLEAIAAGAPDDFTHENVNPLERIEISDRDEIKNENEQTVAKMAKNKGD